MSAQYIAWDIRQIASCHLWNQSIILEIVLKAPLAFFKQHAENANKVIIYRTFRGLITIALIYIYIDWPC